LDAHERDDAGPGPIRQHGGADLDDLGRASLQAFEHAVGARFACGGDFDDAIFLPVADWVANTIAGAFNLAGDPALEVKSQKAEELLRIISRPDSGGAKAGRTANNSRLVIMACLL